MHLVTMTDARGQQFQYDADIKVRTADDGLGFFIGQFTGLQAQVYETKYPDIIFPDLIPVDTSDPEWIDDVAYVSYNGVTMGKFIAANGRDLPQVDIEASISRIPVGYAGNSFGYTVEELRKAMAVRIPLDASKARLAYRGAMIHSQQVAFFGDADRKMTGLLNNPNVPLTNANIDPATATGDDWLAIINGLLTQVYTTTLGAHNVNMVLLPQGVYAKLATARLSQYNAMTILEFLSQYNTTTAQTGQRVTFRGLPQLNNAGENGEGRIIAYELNADNLTMRNPIPWRALVPQPTALRIEVPCEYKISGTEFRFPLSAIYADVPSLS